MADDSEDESVLFEGSPLLEHLRDVGVAQDLQISAVKRSQMEVHVPPLVIAGTASVVWCKDQLSHAHCLLVNFVQDLSGFRHAKQHIVKQLLQSRLLSRDDRNLLEVFDGPDFLIQTPFDRTDSSMDEAATKSVLPARYLVLSAIITGIALLLAQNLLASLLIVVVAVLALAIFLCHMIAGQVMATVGDWQRHCEVLDVALKRSLRLMQDIEVVHHGFLRLPLLGHIDDVDRYLCSIDVNVPSSLQLQQFEKGECSLDHSHSYLKMYVNLLKSQQSECIRRLLLCFSSKATKVTAGIGLYLSLWTLTKSCMAVVVEQHRHLQAALDYMHSKLSDSPPPPPLSQRERQCEENRFAPLSRLSHNLQLHLHTALERSTHLRSTFSNASATEEGNADQDNWTEITQAYIDLVLVSISSSQSCVTDITDTLQELCRVQATSVAEELPGFGSDTEDESSCQDGGSGDVKGNHENSESEDEEKVYEATVDSSDESDTETRKLPPAERRAEMERRLREAEEPFRMVKELKAVLSSRHANDVLRKSARSAAKSGSVAAPSVSAAVHPPTTVSPPQDIASLATSNRDESLSRNPGQENGQHHSSLSDLDSLLGRSVLRQSGHETPEPLDPATSLADVRQLPSSHNANMSTPVGVLAAEPSQTGRSERSIVGNADQQTLAGELRESIPATPWLTRDAGSGASMAWMAATLAMQARSSAGLGDVETFGSDGSGDSSDNSEETCGD